MNDNNGLARPRVDARRSCTGPRSRAGKSIASRNALRHGLCANPAAGAVEDAALFRRLHRDLIEDLLPGNVVEHGLVHRIAHCLWRLQRAAKVDAAVSTLAVEAVVPQRQEVQDWIRQINEAWTVRTVEETDQHRLKQRRQTGQLHAEQRWYRFLRPELAYLDQRRQQVMMSCGAAITAMAVMIEDLAQRLQDQPVHFGGKDAEQLAWLLGDGASEYPADDPDCRFGDIPPPDPTTSLVLKIRTAAHRPLGEPVAKDLESLVVCRLRMLRQMRQVCEHPYVREQDEMARVAALLPGEKDLERLARYEAHAERSLHRSLEMMAKLRGATVESIWACLGNRLPGGTAVAIHDEGSCRLPRSLPHNSISTQNCETNCSDVDANPRFISFRR